MNDAAPVRNLRPLAGGLVVLLSGLLLATGSRGQPKEQERPERTYLGATKCAKCHAMGPAGGDDDDFVLLTEYTTWRLQDKHSFAHLALMGRRAVEMGKNLGIEDVSEDPSCTSCHSFRPKKKEAGFDPRVGVGCEMCHGPAKDWYNDHQSPTWRLKDPAEKEKDTGMVNLRDPATCAKVCMSCHVGSAAEGSVVTHAMYAAGHPPLPNFELGLFRRNMPPHWREKRDVAFFNQEKMTIGKEPVEHPEEIRKFYHLEGKDTQQAQLVRAGAVAAVRCALELTRRRADFHAAERLDCAQLEQHWPEMKWKLPDGGCPPLTSLWPQVFMAQADCYACHHELTTRSWRQVRGYTGRPGRPQLRSWPFALAGQGLGIGEETAEFYRRVGAVEAVCNERPFGEAGKLREAAKVLSDWSHDRLIKLHPPADPLAMMLRLCKLGPDQYPDYDSARQIAAALSVIYDEWAPKLENGPKIRTILDCLACEFDLQPYEVGRKERSKLVLYQVLKAADPKSIDDSLPALVALADQRLSKLSQKQQDVVKPLLTAFWGKSGPDLTDAIVKGNPKDPKSFLAQMDAINESELREAMKKVTEYDPVVFKKQLSELAALLPPAAR